MTVRRPAKVQALATGMPLRKAATTASAAARRSFPAWIDASEHSVAFPAATVTTRVRDGLVLRTVAKKKTAKAKNSDAGAG